MNKIYNKILAQQILLLIVFVISTRANGLANSNYLLTFGLIYALIVTSYYKVKISKYFFVFLLIFGLLVLQNYFRLEKDFDITRYLKLISLILISYLTVQLLGNNFIIYFKNIVTKFLIISIPLYLWQLISVKSLLSVSNLLYSLSPDVFEKSEDFAPSIIIFTIESIETYRNSGPMWEPGGFAAVLVLAFYFELLLSGNKITKRGILLILGIITTFSTTGLIITSLIFLNHLLNRSLNTDKNLRFFYRGIIIPVICIIFITIFFKNDILYNKIQHEYKSQMWTIDNINLYQGNNEINNKLKSLGRFGSLYLDLESIKNTPIFGRGYSDGNYRSEYSEFNFTNGLSNFVGRMGLFGLIWLLISIYKSERQIKLDNKINSRNINMLSFIILIISFSNPVLFTPLFISFQIYFLRFNKVVIANRLTINRETQKALDYSLEVNMKTSL